MMTCRYISEFLADYLDGSLPWWQRMIFQFHLACCADCRRYLHSYRETVRALRALGESPAEDQASRDAIPTELTQAVFAARREYLKYREPSSKPQ
jgi:predicted anti-sigma-YlaC factor YlaD